MTIYSHCINCGEQLTRTEQMICDKCIETDKNNEKLQELKRTSVRVR